MYKNIDKPLSELRALLPQRTSRVIQGRVKYVKKKLVSNLVKKQQTGTKAPTVAGSKPSLSVSCSLGPLWPSAMR
jgi:hypothetical protein